MVEEATAIVLEFNGKEFLKECEFLMYEQACRYLEEAFREERRKEHELGEYSG